MGNQEEEENGCVSRPGGCLSSGSVDQGGALGESRVGGGLLCADEEVDLCCFAVDSISWLISRRTEPEMIRFAGVGVEPICIYGVMIGISGI